MGEHGSEKKGEFLLRSPLSVSCPLPSSSSLLLFFTVTESSGHARGTLSHHFIHPAFHGSLHIPLSLSLPSRLLLHITFSGFSPAYYVRFDIVAYPIPSPPAFLASRPPPSITQKEEGQGRRQGSKRKDKRSGERIREGQENESHKETIRKQRENVRGKDNQKEI